jgi:hypothetical protein
MKRDPAIRKLEVPLLGSEIIIRRVHQPEDLHDPDKWERNAEVQVLVRSLYPNLSSNAVLGRTLREAINRL